MFAVKFSVTFIFSNFNTNLHKFMSQKGLTFYVRAIINVAKIAIIHEFGNINVAKNTKNIISLHCWKKTAKNHLNKRSVLTNI